MSQFCDSFALLISVEEFVFVERFVSVELLVFAEGQVWYHRHNESAVRQVARLNVCCRLDTLLSIATAFQLFDDIHSEIVERQEVVQGSENNWDKSQSVGVHHKCIKKGYQIADCVVLMQQIFLSVLLLVCICLSTRVQLCQTHV